MLTILIADDEKNIRAGIHKILSESIDCDIRFLEAKNGLEALELIETERPEILVTDIRMPKMDGIELMQKISGFDFRPSIIVLSGYDEFSYAREAIRSGAVAYILKPVDRNELIRSVTQAITELEKTRKSSIERSILQIIAEGRVTNKQLPGFDAFRSSFYFLLVTGIDGGSAGVIAECAQCYVLERKSDSVHLLVHRDDLDPLLARLAGDSLRIGVSAPCRSLANIRAAWRQAELASLMAFFEAGGGVFRYSAPDAPLDRADFNARVQKLTMLLETGDESSVSACIDELISFDGLGPGDGAAYLYMVHDFVSTGMIRKYWDCTDSDMYLGLKGIMIENIHLFRTVEDYRKSVREYAVYLNSLIRRAHAEYPFVAQALEYVNAHFTEDINMTVVANHVSVNYTYFSEKFKEHTGMNFNDYIKQLRINEAKRLLEKGCYKVYEVAESSGFGDVKYFMKIFKEITGISPGEYRKQF